MVMKPGLVLERCLGVQCLAHKKPDVPIMNSVAPCLATITPSLDTTLGCVKCNTSWQTWWSTTNDVPQQNPPIVANEFSIETDIMSTSLIWGEGNNMMQRGFSFYFKFYFCWWQAIATFLCLFIYLTPEERGRFIKILEFCQCFQSFSLKLYLRELRAFIKFDTNGCG